MSVEAIAGVRIGVDRIGSGAPALIFVHGGFCDRRDWSAQVQALSPRFRVVTLDLPGHGESGLPAIASIAELARTVCEVKARHGADSAVLVGHSLGCHVILEAFRQSPTCIAGLVLIEGGLIATDDPQRVGNAVKAKLSALGLQEFLRVSFQDMFVSGSDPELRRRVLSRIERLNPKFAESILLSSIDWDANEAQRALARANVPVLVLQSTHRDENLKVRSLAPGMATPWTELVTRLVQDSEFHILAGTGHFAQIEAAPIVSQYIGEFAARLQQPSARS